MSSFACRLRTPGYDSGTAAGRPPGASRRTSSPPPPPPPPPAPAVRDSLFNGAAIGAAIGGGAALAAMARACSNTHCSDTSANLDPRMALVGALAGAGIGALVDAAIGGQKTAPSRARSLTRAPGIVFARAGWSGLSDDEGSLGSGATFGAGVVVPLGLRFGLQIAYDRQTHRRDLESGAPPGVAPPPAGFSGTEQLFTAKALMFFREDKAVRPYAGLGLGLFDSRRVSRIPQLHGCARRNHRPHRFRGLPIPFE